MAWHKYRPWDRDHNASHYSVMKGKINTLSESLMQFSRESFKRLWDNLPITQACVSPDEQANFELALFASQDTAPVCGVRTPSRKVKRA